MKYCKNIIVFIVTIIMMLMQSCSLLIDGYNRSVGYNSICWEDNDHILVYASISAYDNYITIGGEAKNLIWSGGEIWRIDVNTGEKEILLRVKSDKYTLHYENVVITLHDTLRIISDWNISYQMGENYNNWESIGVLTYPQISEDGKKIVYLKQSNELDKDYIEKMDLDTGEKTILWETTDNINSMDYDFDRNLLLLNNIRLINLNTGMDTILLHHGEEISGYSIYSPYYARYGMFLEDEIIIDIESGNNDVYSKVYIDTDSISNRTLKYELRGVPNSDGTRFAFGVDNGVEIQDGYGTVITKLIFDSSGL